ncbi:hypothetical protein [Chroococcidiopsis sp. TS-821]|nr:hypothetical protein [Chroococcidiopsis sp. TS-821]
MLLCAETVLTVNQTLKIPSDVLLPVPCNNYSLSLCVRVTAIAVN